MLGGKVVDTKFVVIPTFIQFQVKLGIPWFPSMQDIASPLHKYLKLIHDGETQTINHSLYHPSRPHDFSTIDLFWFPISSSTSSHPDDLFQSYQTFECQKICELSFS